MNNVRRVKFEDLKEVVHVMKKRAEDDATKNMIEDFEKEKKDCEYYLAKSGEKYGLMSITSPPSVKKGETSKKVNEKIDNSIWVEGLVADSKSGLGNVLLAVAELRAIDLKKQYVTLAAYEYDQEPNPNKKDRVNKLYSMSGYYAEKRGYTFTGEGYLEHKGNNEVLIYPIYYISVEKTMLILQVSKDEQFQRSKL